MGEKWFPTVPTFDSPEEERQHRKQRLAAGFRLFAKFGFEEGVAGHITARDPIEPDTFRVNPFGVPFAHGRAPAPRTRRPPPTALSPSSPTPTPARRAPPPPPPPPQLPLLFFLSTRRCTP